MSLWLQILLYHNYNYTAPENVGREVLLGQVSPLFHTAKEQCPGGRGLECKMLQALAAEDSKEGEQTLRLGHLVVWKKNTSKKIKI